MRSIYSIVLISVLLLASTQGQERQASQQVDQSDKVISSSYLDGESAMRKLLIDHFPRLESEVYFYDGLQIFGIFRDPAKPDRFFVFLQSPARFEPKSFEVQGKKFDPTVEAETIRYWIPSAEGGADSDTHSGGFLVGSWILVPSKTSVSFQFRIIASYGTYDLSASRSAEGRWSGTMKKAEQDGADQPATAPESKPEGKEKAKPESKVRPQ